MTVLGVIVLAGVGAVARWQMANLFNRGHLPLGTLAVNLSGSFVLGLLAQQSNATLTIVGLGLLGSLTTFSTIMLESTDLARPKAVAAMYLTITVLGGVAAAALGLELS